MFVCIGWDFGSCAYHGDDGMLFYESGTGKPLGPLFGAGDTVGCGLIPYSHTVFFTLNGIETFMSEKTSSLSSLIKDCMHMFLFSALNLFHTLTHTYTHIHTHTQVRTQIRNRNKYKTKQSKASHSSKNQAS